VNAAVGVDLIEVARIRRAFTRHPSRFLARHYTEREQQECGHDASRLATRWAAKEAAVKALGTGIGPVGWRDVEVLCDASGAPSLHLHGRATAVAAARGLDTWSVSLSHTVDHAVAVVAAVGVPRRETVGPASSIM
jgi:holo-[acyl-carrier protein] synthase